MSESKVSFVFLLVFIVSVNTSKIFATRSKYNDPVPCEDDIDCIELKDSKCEDYFCMCNSSKICEHHNEEILSEIGQSCIHDRDCYLANSECHQHECTCKSGFVHSTNNKKCLMISEGIGSSCDDSVQCFTKIKFGGCQQNKCVCQQHTHEYNGSCYRDVELDQNCIDNAECAFIENSECINSKCTCVNKYVASTRGSRCLPVAEGYKTLCVDNTQCTTELGIGSECFNGSCDCKEMYQFNHKANKCVLDILLGEICGKHSDCHEPYKETSRLECILGECKCKSFYTEMNGFCISSSENTKHYLILIIFNIVLLRTLF